MCRTNKNNPSLSLIKTICYPENIKFTTKATSWGISHEKDAVDACIQEMEKEKHVISKFWPQLAASSDRLVFCECCLGGCLEVKCPYNLNTKCITSIEDYVNIKGSCLIFEDNKVQLGKNHSYYFQCQMQVFVSNLKYCDFVIWSPYVFYKTRILPDFKFWDDNLNIALKFHEEVIMVELLVSQRKRALQQFLTGVFLKVWTMEDQC